VDRVYVCNCFGVTEEQVKKHAEGGACTPRQIASACKAGTDCGSCVRRIQALLGRGACPSGELVDRSEPVRAGSVRAEPVLTEPVLAESVRTEPAFAELDEAA
jgi:bacterioferritin-associated ferredoxin